MKLNVVGLLYMVMLKMEEVEGLPLNMDRIICWNIRGVDHAKKQKDVKKYINVGAIGAG